MSNETTQMPTVEQVSQSTTSTKKKGGLGKVLLIGCGLLFLCFFLCGIFFVLFGYIETNEECQYRGPLAPESDYCKDDEKEDKKNDKKGKDEVVSDSDEDEDIEPVYVEDEDNLTYDGSFYAIDYPQDWSYEESSILDDDYKVTFTSSNGSDNLILNEIYTNEFSVSEKNCSDYADALEDELIGFYEESSIKDYSVTTLGGGEACRVELTGVLSGVELMQVQYYVVDTVFDSYAYILTLTSSSRSGMNQLEAMADSFIIK